jgi:hypothetical protein
MRCPQLALNLKQYLADFLVKLTVTRFDPDLRIDEQNYDDGSNQNDQPIGNLNARYGCFPVNPAHRVLPVRPPQVMASS